MTSESTAEKAAGAILTVDLGALAANYALLCEKNDLISVPDGTRHWFDMGPEPEFTCIRLFSNPEGWVASFTGEDIASRLPRYESLAGGA